MKIKVYNLEGKEAGEMELADGVFAVKVKPGVVHEIFVAQTGRQRQPWAHSKDRGEVSGGGRKPWRQKGTGRARHGSIRSPLWKGGGVIFGPRKTDNYGSKINKKARRTALKMCLSNRVAEGNLWVVEDFNFSDKKTKVFAKFLQALPSKKKSCLVLTSKKNETVLRLTNNLKEVKVMRAQDLNIVEILNKPELILSKEAVKKLVEIFSK